MKTDALILGAGPAGLSAAYALSKAGKKVVVIEKSEVAGGQMRSIKKDDFILDLGYKHLYNRIPEVHRFWSDLLGDDFIRYTPRTGMLFDNIIFEKEKHFKGIRRGMPVPLLLSACVDLLRGRIKYKSTPLITLQDFAYSRRGEMFTRIFSQGFDERVKGRKWSQLPAPKAHPVQKAKRKQNFFLSFYKEAVRNREVQTDWYHPAKGTGQIIQKLKEGIIKSGGEICLSTEVIETQQQGNKVIRMTVNGPAGKIQYEPDTVISSLPLEAIAEIMDIPCAPNTHELSFKRSVVMVYLFLDNEVSFPHNCIQISGPKLRMGRITNYGAYGGTMVPAGKGCICIEFFCFRDSDFFALSDDELYDIAISECEMAEILTRDRCRDYLIFKGPGIDPATSWEDFITDPSRVAIFKTLEVYTNLYQISRTGIDRSTNTGLIAAQSVLDNDGKNRYAALTRPDLFEPWLTTKATS